MKDKFIFLNIVYIFLFVCGSVCAQGALSAGEKTISLGGSSSWAGAENRTGITEAAGIRPFNVLALSSAPTVSRFDMSVSFDEREPRLFRDITGNYKVASPANPGTASQTFSRSGAGSAFFNSHSEGPITITPQSRGALFAPGNRIGDFTIEFWLYPLNMENGERIFSWVSSVSHNGSTKTQRIQCTASRNRLQWSFENFFTSFNIVPNSSSFVYSHVNINFSGSAAIVPKTWSHHLIRFDSQTGLLEYLVNGTSEAIKYATATGRENSDVFTPIAGTGGAFLLGEKYTGFIDELKIHNTCAGRSILQRYQSAGGRMETKAIDLGAVSSSVLRINVTGGRAGSATRNSSINEFRENGVFRFADEAQINFFIRSSENPWLLSGASWTNFTPGRDISGIKGRYVQIAADFYPSADGETSPYLERINIVYNGGEPPMPPRNVTAVAIDGGVRLSWRHSPNANGQALDETSDFSGYLVYYSSVRGDLFGEDAALGKSPIDVGITNNVVINGLKNGALYYFRVAAYDKVSGLQTYNIGEFSAEVTARPLSGL